MYKTKTGMVIKNDKELENYHRIMDENQNYCWQEDCVFQTEHDAQNSWVL